MARAVISTTTPRGRDCHFLRNDCMGKSCVRGTRAAPPAGRAWRRAGAAGRRPTRVRRCRDGARAGGGAYTGRGALLDEFQALVLLQVVQQRFVDRDRRARRPASGHAVDVVVAGDVVAHRGQVGLVGDDVLAFLRQHVVHPQLGGVAVLGLLADEGHARQHQRVVGRVGDAQRRIVLGAGLGVRTQDVVADQVLARGHAFHHGAGGRLHDQAALGDVLERVEVLGIIGLVLHGQHEAHGRLLDVVGGDLVLELVRLAGDQRPARRAWWALRRPGSGACCR